MKSKSKTLRVNVTLFDIHDGVRSKCSACPVTLATLRALQQAFPKLDRRLTVRTNGTTLRIGLIRRGWELFMGDGECVAHFPLVPKAYMFVVAFDEHGPSHVRPFSFDFTLYGDSVAKLREAA